MRRGVRTVLELACIALMALLATAAVILIFDMPVQLIYLLID